VRTIEGLGSEASNATTATQQAASPTQAKSDSPSVIIVEVLGYGGGTDGEEQRRKADERRSDLSAPSRTAS
jgi:hypothetical protein